MVDGPGHGKSPGPGRRFTLDDCADAAITVLQTMGVDSVDWVGNAWGGHVGILVAARQPSLVRSLTALASPLPGLSRQERRRIVPLVALYRLFGPRPLVGAVTSALLSQAIDDGGGWPTETVR
ncbi:MAG: alpha/beta fold hydrolase, partial [Acidimicrobiia bacterium]